MLVRRNYFCAMSPVSASAKTKNSARSSHHFGFSLVELLVVVMVILVIAAIAIPSLLQARIKANEAAAVASMKTIEYAETMYSSEYPEEGFSPNLVWLGPNGSDCEKPGPKSACIIMDETLLSGLKNGYIFELLGDGKTPSASYTLTAKPESAGFSGNCSYTSGPSGDLVRTAPDSGSQGRLSMGGSGGC
jgi:prepilin-type N-terminal cleavage/methylation domain-containing protein